MCSMCLGVTAMVITSTPVLSYFDNRKETVLSVDASSIDNGRGNQLLSV